MSMVICRDRSKFTLDAVDKTQAERMCKEDLALWVLVYLKVRSSVHEFKTFLSGSNNWENLALLLLKVEKLTSTTLRLINFLANLLI